VNFDEPKISILLVNENACKFATGTYESSRRLTPLRHQRRWFC